MAGIFLNFKLNFNHVCGTDIVGENQLHFMGQVHTSSEITCCITNVGVCMVLPQVLYLSWHCDNTVTSSIKHTY